MKRTLALMLILGACAKQAPPVAPETAMTMSSTAAVEPGVTLPDGVTYRVEVVADNEQRAQGLMFRDHLRPNSGMLFVFPEDGVYPFWMKNTLIPLDMIWIDAQQTIVHVKNDVPPCKIEDCPSYSPEVSARYVLELAAGEAKKHNLKAGDRLTFSDLGSVQVR